MKVVNYSKIIHKERTDKTMAELSHLDQLEAEAIYIIREVAAECEKPENCLVVEDALAGIDAAYAGGFISAGIGDAASHKYVTYPIHTFSDLLSIDKL